MVGLGQVSEAEGALSLVLHPQDCLFVLCPLRLHVGWAQVQCVDDFVLMFDKP